MKTPKINNSISDSTQIAKILTEKVNGVNDSREIVLKNIITKVEQLAVYEKSFVVTSANKSDANEFGSRLKKFQRVVDERRKELKAPALQECQEIDGVLQPVVKLLSSMADSVGRKLTAVLQIERRLAEEEAEKAAAAARKQAEKEAREEGLNKAQAAIVGKEVAAVVFNNVAQSAPTGLSTAGGSSKMSAKKGFVVNDISKVPISFLMVDRDKVMAAINSGVLDIPGITVTETESVQFRSR